VAPTERRAAGGSLRVLHVVEAFGGGVFEVVRTLAEKLADDGDAVAIAFGRRPETPHSVRELVAPQVELYEMPWSRRGVREQLRAGRELRRLVRTWQPDLIHLHSSFAGAVGALALGRSTPTIYTPHGYSFTMRDQSPARRRAYRALERFTASRMTLVGAVSAAEARAACEVASAAKVIVVANGIPELDGLDPDAPLPHLAERPRAITIGRIDEARMPAAAAGILAEVSDLAEVEWVGGGGRGGVPESTVTDRGVPVSGWLGHEEALAKLRAASACLHWTAWDGQPLSILEAMANDVVVVARDIEPTREMLGPRQVCGSEQEAVSMLRQVLSDPLMHEELLLAQRDLRRRYGARRMADEWRRAYTGIAATESAPEHPLHEGHRRPANQVDLRGQAQFGRPTRL
jgi:glycosyltransferase involved in cell wall biosynthesis